MKFDEAIDMIDVNGTLIDTLGVLQALQQEYAPTVEMTKNKVKEVNSIVHEVGEKFEQDELPDDIKITDKMIELEDGFVVLKYLNVILHPEIIKMVDE